MTFGRLNFSSYIYYVIKREIIMTSLMTTLKENEFKYFVEWFNDNHPIALTKNMVDADYRKEFKSYN